MMKHLTVVLASLLLTSIAGLAQAQSGAQAQDEPPLGKYHFSVEWDVMAMQHVTFDTDGVGFRVGLDGYRQLAGNWYGGVELSAGGGFSLFGSSNDITSIEANGKYVVPLTGWLCLDAGAGLSANHVEYHELHVFSSDTDVDIEDWVAGVQALLNLHAKLGQFLVGLQAKYQLTTDVEGVAELQELEKGWDYSNLTLGFHVGFFTR